MGNEMLFGIYHTDCRKNVERFKQLVSSDFINTFLIEGDIDDEYFSMNFELSKEYPEKNFWISVGKLGFYHEKMKVADVGEKAHVPKTCFYEDFEDRVDKLIGFLKEKGYYDRVCGFYMDEPMLWGVTNEQLKTFTKYFRTVVAPEKRIFVCFSLAGVAPEFWTIRGAEAVTPDSSQYLTDIAFDMYHKWSDVYFEIYKKMMERTGNRTDIKVWFIPCTMDYRGNKTEEHCLEHLENCYKLLLIALPKDPGTSFIIEYYLDAKLPTITEAGSMTLSEVSFVDKRPGDVEIGEIYDVSASLGLDRQYTVTAESGAVVVSWTAERDIWAKAWQNISGYKAENNGKYLKLTFTSEQKTKVGIYLSGGVTALLGHTEYEAGTHTVYIELPEEMTEDFVLEYYFDAGVSPLAAGSISFTEISFTAEKPTT